MTTPVPDGSMMAALLGVLDAEQQRRHDKGQAKLAAMTVREGQLVREAAVMGYVRGHIAGKGGMVTIPPDTWVLHHVIECCLSFPDLYPTIGSLGKMGDVMTVINVRSSEVPPEPANGAMVLRNACAVWIRDDRAAEGVEDHWWMLDDGNWREDPMTWQDLVTKSRTLTVLEPTEQVTG